VPYRDRIELRSPLAKWTRRVAGLLATVAFFAAGAYAVQMVLGTKENEAASVPSRDAPNPKLGKGGKQKAEKLTKQQRAERNRAVATMRRAGYTPVSRDDYRGANTLRVMIGKPFGASPPGLRAFFFVGDEPIGQDADQPSGALRVLASRDRAAVLVYTLYDDGDRACCPRGRRVRVRFDWTGDTLTPRSDIPPDAERVPPT
jgi:hypothetical protein